MPSMYISCGKTSVEFFSKEKAPFWANFKLIKCGEHRSCADGRASTPVKPNRDEA